MKGIKVLLFVFILLLLVIVLAFAFLSNTHNESPSLKVTEALDTIWITNEPNHGYYEIMDSLTIYSGWPLLNSDLCDTMEHRSEPIWSPNDYPYICTISDLYPPFQIYKRAHSDTLFVIKDGNTIMYRMRNE